MISLALHTHTPLHTHTDTRSHAHAHTYKYTCKMAKKISRQTEAVEPDYITGYDGNK